MKRRKRINWVAVFNMVGVISALVYIISLFFKGIYVAEIGLLLTALLTVYLNLNYFKERIK